MAIRIGRVFGVGVLMVASAVGGAALHARGTRAGWRWAGGRGAAGGLQPATAVLRVAGVRGTHGTDEGDYRRNTDTRAAEIRLTATASLRQAFQNADAPVRKTKWFEGFNGDVDAAAAALDRALSVAPLPGTSLLAVRVAGPPEDATVLANVVCDGFLDWLRAREQSRIERRVNEANRDARRVDIELNEEVTKQLRQTETSLGVDGVIEEDDRTFNIISMELAELMKATVAARFASAATRPADHSAPPGDGSMPAAAGVTADTRGTAEALELRRNQLGANLADVAKVLSEQRQMRERQTYLRHRLDQLNAERQALQAEAERPPIGVELIFRATAKP